MSGSQSNSQYEQAMVNTATTPEKKEDAKRELTTCQSHTVKGGWWPWSSKKTELENEIANSEMEKAKLTFLQSLKDYTMQVNENKVLDMTIGDSGGYVLWKNARPGLISEAQEYGHLINVPTNILENKYLYDVKDYLREVFKIGFQKGGRRSTSLEATTYMNMKHLLGTEKLSKYEDTKELVYKELIHQLYLLVKKHKINIDEEIQTMRANYEGYVDKINNLKAEPLKTAGGDDNSGGMYGVLIIIVILLAAIISSVEYVVEQSGLLLFFINLSALGLASYATYALVE